MKLFVSQSSIKWWSDYLRTYPASRCIKYTEIQHRCSQTQFKAVGAWCWDAEYSSWWRSLNDDEHWDHRSPLVSKARCTIESQEWATYGPGWGDILKGPPVWLNSQHIYHILRQSWSTWVSSCSKRRGTLGSVAFATLGCRGGWYHLFWGWDRAVSIYNYSPLVETKIAECLCI